MAVYMRTVLEMCRVTHYFQMAYFPATVEAPVSGHRREAEIVSVTRVACEQALGPRNPNPEP